MNFLLLLALILPMISFGSDDQLNFQKWNGIRISKNRECLEEIAHPTKIYKGCLAKKWIDEKIDNSAGVSTGPGGSNPSSLLCLKIEGKLQKVKDKKGDETSLCVFEDGSFIFSWDLIKIIK